MYVLLMTVEQYLLLRGKRCRFFYATKYAGAQGPALSFCMWCLHRTLHT
jgi:hypothetical protein